MDLDFSTAEVGPGERLTALREAVQSRFLALSIRPLNSSVHHGGIHGAISTREFDGLRIACFSGSPITAARTPGHVEHSAADDYLLALHTRGVARVGQCGRQVTLRPGDLALLDSARPYTIELANSGPFEHIAYQIPRSRLDARADSLQRLLAVRIPAGSDPGRLSSPYLRTLASPAWRTPAASAGPFIEAGLDLLVGALLLAAGEAVPSASAQAQLLLVLKRYAASNLGDTGLSPTRVAKAHYVSVRQLHRLFAREGTSFGAWVRNERLRRCRRDLADQRLRDLPIADIAARWGYRSPAHFTRAFTAQYDVGPRDFRHAALGRGRDLERQRPGS